MQQGSAGYPRRGEVWWAEPPQESVSSYQKTRPWLIVSNDKANEHSPFVTAVPCTTMEKREWMPTHVEVQLFTKRNVIQCEQIRTFGKEYLKGYMLRIHGHWMEEVDEALAVQLGLERGER